MKIYSPKLSVPFDGWTSFEALAEFLEAHSSEEKACAYVVKHVLSGDYYSQLSSEKLMAEARKHVQVREIK